jgi:toxin ParE1/3/4
MKVRYSAAALKDLRDIARFIAADSPEHARKFVARLERECAALGSAPLIFPRISRFADLGLRRKVYRDHLIFYQVTDVVMIFRIIHGARDYDALLAHEVD